MSLNRTYSSAIDILIMLYMNEKTSNMTNMKETKIRSC